MSSRTGDLLSVTVRDMLSDVCGSDVVLEAEESGWAPSVWGALADAGLPWVSVPEDAGGSGGEAGDAYTIVRLAGRFAVPAPVAETGLLAGWLLSSAGLQVPRAPLTVAPPGSHMTLARDTGEWRLSGRAAGVPWAAAAERIVTLAAAEDGTYVASAPATAAAVQPRRNLAGEPRDRVLFDDLPIAAADVARAPTGVDADALLRRGSLARAVLMAGALDGAAELTTAYARTRHQFGRPIGRFQAVAQRLAVLAEHASCAALAADVAARLGPDDVDGVAAARVVAGEAGRVVTEAAHQIHGAIGMTREYELHLLTRRLWAWRDEFGTTSYWSRRLGRRTITAGPERLWPSIASGLTEES